VIKNNQIISALENIYISPAEICNLNCRLCYTNKTKNILSNERILNFVENYRKMFHSQDFFSTLNLVTDSQEKKNFNKKHDFKLKSILFCGGEVFILPEFTDLINTLIKKNIFITIITNGTVDKLDEIHDPSNCQLLVSLDGPKKIHDQNRGVGNFDKSINFIKHAKKLGFPVEVMFLVTPESYSYKDSFPKELNKLYKLSKLNLNYITQKTFFYTDNHPLSNQNNKNTALTPSQIIDIKKNYPSVPNKYFGCFQLTLQSNGLIYGCCESPVSIGKIDDDPKIYVKKFVDSLITCSHCPLNSTTKILSSQPTCFGCCCPDFLCGYKKELNQKDCKGVVKLFN
jgi:MoaA/NifB/PqqE/SkfB family radical SAM enzyme